MNKIIGHLKTINKHKIEVTKLLFKCGLYGQGIKHDLSKYSLAELKTGFRYFTGTRSPIEKERKALGYSQSWLHHKGHNKHHWEYWIDKDFTGHGMSVNAIPTEYIIEMFCDRIAAAKTYQKEKYTNSSAYDYFMSGTDRFIMGYSNAIRLASLLDLVKTFGEEAVVKMIRNSEDIEKFLDQLELKLHDKLRH